VAVSKAHSVEQVREAYRNGVRHFGENYVSEPQVACANIILLYLLPYLVGFSDLIWQVQELHSKAMQSKVISALTMHPSFHSLCVVIYRT